MTDDGLAWEQKQRIRGEWCKMLAAQGFDCFYTVTFKQPAVSPAIAIGRVKRLLSEFYNQVGGEVAAFVVAEPHQNGTYHAHGLLRLGVSGAFQNLYLSGLWKMAYDHYGRSRFEMIESQERVQGYVAKYLLKMVCDFAFIGRGLRRAGTKPCQGSGQNVLSSEGGLL